MKKASGRRQIDMEAVLDGRVTLSAEGLLGLIHEINPTDLRLPLAEETRRYTLKARLQSLLIRRHAAMLSYVEDAPGVVAIRYGFGQLDGCHAPLTELEDDARAVVRHALDAQAGKALAGPTVRGRASAAPAPAPVDLLAQAQAALDEYDYEGARALLSEAFDRSEGGVEQARALFELLVDVMVDDGEVVRRARQLSRAAANQPGVRAMVALAAAREGDVGAARQWLVEADGPHVALALGQISARHLDEGDLAGAAGVLAALRQLDPGHADVLRLTDRLHSLRSAQRQPAEQRLRELLDAGELDRAEAEARAVLGVFADSAVARTVLQEVALRRRSAQLVELQARVDAALAAGDAAAAVVAFKRILALGPDPEVERRLAEAQARLAQRVEAERVRSVVARLQAPDVAGLVAYAELTSAARADVRAEITSPLLRWAEEAGLPRQHGRLREGAAAIFALEAAERRLSRDDDAEGVLAALRKVEVALSEVGAWREAVAHATRRVAARDQRRAEEALEESRLALEAGDLPRSRTAGAKVVARALDAEGRARLEQLQARLGAAEESVQLAARVEAAPNVVEALAVANVLLARTSGAEHTGWLARAGALAEAVRADTCPGIVDGDGLRAEDSFSDLMGADELPELVLSADGRSLVTGATRGRWLFLHELSVESGACLWACSLRLPAAVRFPSFVVDGDHIWVSDTGTHVARIDRRTGELRRFVCLDAFEPGDKQGTGVIVVPGWSVVRLKLEGRDLSEAEVLIDLNDLRRLRERDGVRGLGVVPSGQEPRVAAYSESLKVMTLTTPDGRSPIRIAAPRGYQPISVAQLPLPEHWLVVAADFEELDDDEARPALHFVHGPAGAMKAHEIGGIVGDATIQLAASRESELQFVLAVDGEGHPVVIASRWVDLRPEELYRCRVPRGATLLQDLEGRHVVGYAQTLEGPLVFGLTERPPVLPWWGEVGPRAMLQPPFYCFRIGRLDGTVGPEAAAFASTPLSQRAAWVASRCEASPDAGSLRSLYRAVWSDRDRQLGLRVVEAMIERFPDSSDGRLQRAIVAAGAGRWEGVRALLSDLELDDLEEQAEHARHLLAVAHLELGEPYATLRVLDAHPEGAHRYCSVDTLREVACCALGMPDVEEAIWDSLEESERRGPSSIRRVMEAIRVADAAFQRDDLHGVIAALTLPAVWVELEAQSLSRLAKAWLAVEAKTPVDLHRKRFALASLCGMKRFAHETAENFPLGAASYSPEEIFGLRERASAWLERATDDVGP